MKSKEFEFAFPNLVGSEYDIISPATPDYNCLAWALGFDDDWLEPDPFNQYPWPLQIREYTLESYIKVIEISNYETCQDSQFENGFEKIAIYLSGGIPKHFARQHSSELWTSKCGKSEDIIHTLQGLEGKIYGKAEIFMKRPLTEK